MTVQETIGTKLDNLLNSLIYIRESNREYLKSKYGDDANLAYTPFDVEAEKTKYLRRATNHTSDFFICQDVDNVIENFDNINNGSLPCVIVKFPKLTVLNSRGASHTVTNLFALITLRYDGTLRDIQCVRSTLTGAEYSSAYIFSHANVDRSNIFGKFSSLCFGSGEIADYREALFHKNVLDNKALWGMLPDNLFRYFSWESLEGRPWKEFANISSGRRIELPITGINDCLSNIKSSRAEIFKCRQCKEFLHNFINKNYKKILSNIPIQYKDGKYYISKSNYPELLYNIAVSANYAAIADVYNADCTLEEYSYISNQLLKYREGDSGTSSVRMFKFNGEVIYSLVIDNEIEYKTIKSFNSCTFVYIIYLIQKRLNKDGKKHVLC